MMVATMPMALSGCASPRLRNHWADSTAGKSQKTSLTRSEESANRGNHRWMISAGSNGEKGLGKRKNMLIIRILVRKSLIVSVDRMPDNGVNAAPTKDAINVIISAPTKCADASLYRLSSR